MPRPLESCFLGTLTVHVADSYLMEPGPWGQRRIDVFASGSFVGPRIRAEMLAGGSDMLLRRADDAMQPDVRLTLRTDDGAIIQMTYRGVRHGSPEVMARIARGEEVAPHEYYLRNTPYFETGHPRYDWLNRIVAVGIGRREPGCAVYDIHEVL